jgi:TonB family protein
MKSVLLVGWLILGAAQPQGQNQEVRVTLSPSIDAIARARTLYAAAAYEDALASLPSSPVPGEEDAVDRYRTLCLLALGRAADAERTVEQALARNPGFQIAEGEISPRVMDFFQEVRRRVLPIRAESLYSRARVEFEDRHYADAVETFTLVLELLSDPEVASVGKLSDLRLVAEEFRKLARERLPADAIGRRAAEEPLDADRIYTRLSDNVKPPVEIDRPMPRWNPPRDQAWRSFRGVIEVLVDRAGRVEQAQMLERIASFYDRPLVEAARSWRFKPATRDGVPVRFRQQIEIIMRPEE